MPFEGVYGLGGTEYTYRAFWVITLGSYAAFVVASGSGLTWICSKYSRSGWEMKRENRKWFKLIAGVVCFLYIVGMFMLALLNGLMVFGGDSIFVYVAALLSVQTIFAMLGSFVRAPYLADSIAVLRVGSLRVR